MQIAPTDKPLTRDPAATAADVDRRRKSRRVVAESTAGLASFGELAIVSSFRSGGEQNLVASIHLYQIASCQCRGHHADTGLFTTIMAKQAQTASDATAKIRCPQTERERSDFCFRCEYLGILWLCLSCRNGGRRRGFHAKGTVDACPMNGWRCQGVHALCSRSANSPEHSCRGGRANHSHHPEARLRAFSLCWFQPSG